MRFRLRTLLIVLVVGPMLLAGYALSIGPAVWLSDRGYFSGEDGSVAATIYLPLTSLEESWPPLRVVMRPYITFWRTTLAPQRQTPPWYRPIY